MFLIYDPRLCKYLKVDSTSGTGGTRMISNCDHLLVPVVGIVLAYRYTQGNVTCVSNVAGVGLQFLTQSHGGKYFAIANQYIFNTVRTYHGIFLVLEILRINIASQDSDSDDDVSALSGSDSDILDSRKGRFCRILDDDISMLTGSEGEKDTKVTFK